MTNPLLLHCICSISWSLFVDLPHKKPETVSLGSIGSCREACLDKRRLHVLRKVHDSKTNGWYALRNPSGYTAFVWLLRRSCPTEGNTSAQNSRCDFDHTSNNAQLNQPRVPLTCTPCHVCLGGKCDAPCTSKTNSFHSSTAGTWRFVPSYTTTPASS